MLGADRRGHQEGWRVATALTIVPTFEHIAVLAETTLADLKSQHYAHLTPEDAFLSGFVNGLLLCFRDRLERQAQL